MCAHARESGEKSALGPVAVRSAAAAMERPLGASAGAMARMAVGTMRMTLLPRLARGLLIAMPLGASLAARPAVAAVSRMPVGPLGTALLLLLPFVAVLAAPAVLASVGLDRRGRGEAASAVRLALPDVVAARGGLQPLDRLDRSHESFR